MLDTASYGAWNPFVYEVECPSPAKVGDPITLHVRWANGRTTTSPSGSRSSSNRCTRTASARRQLSYEYEGLPDKLGLVHSVRDQWLSRRGRSDAVHDRAATDRADGPVRRPGADHRRLRAARRRARAARGGPTTEAERPQTEPHRRVPHRAGEGGVAACDPLEGAPAQAGPGEERVEGGRPLLERLPADLARLHLRHELVADRGGVRRLQVVGVPRGDRAGQRSRADRERDALTGPRLEQAGGVAGEQDPSPAERAARGPGSG